MARYLDASVRDGVRITEVALVAASAAIAIAALLAWRAGRNRLAIRLVGTYLVVVTVQLVADVGLLIVATPGGAFVSPAREDLSRHQGGGYVRCTGRHGTR